MKLKLPFALFLASFTLLSASAFGNYNNKPRAERQILHTHDEYISATGGFTLCSNSVIQNTTSNSQEWKFGGSAHVAYGNNMESFVAELEAGFFSNSLKQHTNNGSIATESGGTLRRLTFMANVIQNVFLSDRMDFFWGLGGGPVITNLKITGSPSTLNRIKESNALTFGYQALVGFKIELRHNIEAIAMYRAFSHFNTKHRMYNGTSTTETTKKSVRAPIIQSFELGGRYLF